MGQERLGGLDLLRGIAALAVVALHISIAFPQVETPFARAYLAVDFFFMLSGFVLTRTYHRRFLTGLGAQGFLVLRLRRLWPTVAIGAVLGLVSQAHAYAPQDLTLFLALSLALIPYLGGDQVFPLNGVIWSILFELVANAVHARVLARLSRAELLAFALVMASIMVVAAVKLASFGAGSWDVGAWQGNFVAGLPRVLMAYTIGSLLYLKFGDRPAVRVPAWVAPVLLPAALLVASRIEGGWLFDLVFVLFICPAVVVAGLASYGWAHRLERVAGDLSFPLYAVHMPILLMTARAGLPWYAGPPLAIFGAAVTQQALRQGSRVRALISRDSLPAHSRV